MRHETVPIKRTRYWVLRKEVHLTTNAANFLLNFARVIIIVIFFFSSKKKNVCDQHNPTVEYGIRDVFSRSVLCAILYFLFVILLAGVYEFINKFRDNLFPNTSSAATSLFYCEKELSEKDVIKLWSLKSF